MPVLSAQLLSALTIATTAGLISIRRDDLEPSKALAHIKAALNNTEIGPESYQIISEIVEEAEKAA
jgi:hypothetical protein